MKTGKTIVQLAQELERRRNAKQDFVADTRRVELVTERQLGADVNAPLGVQLAIHNGRGDYVMGVNDIAHRQIGDHTGIPAKYYDRMRTDQPELLATNVNRWLQAEPSKRMIRVLDGNARAFLSDRYRPLENEDLAEAVLPVLNDAQVEILSCEVTERRIYIKAVDGRIRQDIPKGARMGDGSHHIFDTISPALVISNSEVGLGALSVEAGVWTRACTNMAIFSQASMRKYHVGGRHELTENLQELLSDKTKRLTDAATWAQVRDVVAGAFNEAKFTAQAMELRGLTEQKITGDIPEVVELTAKRFNLNDGERRTVLQHLIEGADLTRYGLFNAITRTAEDAESYDRATELERLGGQVISLAANDWRVIAEAA